MILVDNLRISPSLGIRFFSDESIERARKDTGRRCVLFDLCRQLRSWILQETGSFHILSFPINLLGIHKRNHLSQRHLGRLHQRLRWRNINALYNAPKGELQ